MKPKTTNKSLCQFVAQLMEESGHSLEYISVHSDVSISTLERILSDENVRVESLEKVLHEIGGQLAIKSDANSEKELDLEYPLEDWRFEVANGDTYLGHKEWVNHKIESGKNENR